MVDVAGKFISLVQRPKSVYKIHKCILNHIFRPDVEGSVEYEDTPEFRQSLNMEGVAKEAILKKLRDRLGMKEKKKDVKPGSNPKVDWHGDEGK